LVRPCRCVDLSIGLGFHEQMHEKSEKE